MSIARDSLAYWVSQIADFGLRFVTMVFLAVILGPRERGILLGVFLVNSLAVNFTNLGIQVSAMYYASKAPEGRARLHAQLIWLIMAIVAVDLTLAWIFQGWLRAHVFPDIPAPYYWTALGILPLSLYGFAAQGLLTGLGEVRRAARLLFYYSVASSIGNLGVLGLLNTSPKLLFPCLLGVWLACDCGKALVFHAALRRSGCGIERLPRGEIVAGMGKITSFGLRAFYGNFAGQLVNRMDQVAILSRAGAAGLGVYGVAVRMAELIFYPSAAFESAGYRQVAAADREEAGKLVQDLFRANLWLNGLAMAAMLAASGPLIHYVFGEQYRGAAAPMRILLPGALVFSCTRMLALYFNAQLGKPQICSAIAWLGAFFSLPLLYAMVKNGGAGLTTAAAVTSGSYTLMFVVFLVSFAAMTGLRNPLPYFVPQGRDYDRIGKLMRGIRERGGI